MFFESFPDGFSIFPFGFCPVGGDADRLSLSRLFLLTLASAGSFLVLIPALLVCFYFEHFLFVSITAGGDAGRF